MTSLLIAVVLLLAQNGAGSATAGEPLVAGLEQICIGQLVQVEGGQGTGYAHGLRGFLAADRPVLGKHPVEEAAAHGLIEQAQCADVAIALGFHRQISLSPA